MLSRLPHLGSGDVDRVADALGDLPLPVDQAAALLADTGLTIDSYLALLNDRADRVLAHAADGNYPHSLAAAWDVAFERLVADDAQAMQMLTLIAWLAPAPVPSVLTTEITGDPLTAADRIAALRRRGMAQIRPDSRTPPGPRGAASGPHHGRTAGHRRLAY